MTPWTDIAAPERQLAELKLEELSSLETVIEDIELSAVEVESPFPRAGSTAAEIGSVTEKPRLISVGIDSGAEITVWPPELALENTHRGVRGESIRREVLWPRRQARSDTGSPRTPAVYNQGRRDEANSEGSRGSCAETAAGSV